MINRLLKFFSRKSQNNTPSQETIFAAKTEISTAVEMPQIVKPSTQYIYTVTEAAKFLGVSADTLRNWEAAGKLIPKRTAGGSRRYYLNQLNQLINHNPALALKAKSAATQIIASKRRPASDWNTDLPPPPTTTKQSGENLINHYHKIMNALKPGLPKFSNYVVKPFALTIGLPIIAAAIIGIALTPGYLVDYQRVKTNIENISKDSNLPTSASVLGISTEESTVSGHLVINLPTVFNNSVNFQNNSGITTTQLTAPNVIYSISSGDGIDVGYGQTPTITNTGVLSLAGQTGKVALTAGGGISINGLTITNSDTGSAQNIFKTITDGSNSFSAGSNSDTLTFSGGSGISVSADTNDKKITISALNSSNPGFTESSGIVALTTISDLVGIGTANPANKLNVVDTAEQLRLGYDGSNYTSFTTNSSGNLTIAPTGGTTTNNSTTLSFPNATTISASNANATFSSVTAGSVNYTSLSLGDGTAATPALNFTNNTNAGLYRLGSNIIGLTTNGTNTSGITINNGEVGIGTTAPLAGLELGTNGASSTPAELLSGSWFTGGNSTNTKPQLLVEPTGTTSNSWQTTGTGIGVNSTSSFTGYLLDLQVGASSKFHVDYQGNLVTSGSINSGSGNGQNLTLTPTNDSTALTLVGTNVITQNLAYLNAHNAQGTIFNLAYGASQTLTGALTGESIDLNNGQITNSNNNITGLSVKLPTVTDSNTSGTVNIRGLSFGFGSGSGINQTGAGATVYTGIDVALPALTQTSGSLTSNGIQVTTSSQITTGGTANGLNINASGVGAGTLNGINISSITGAAGTENALNIGSGWDNLLSVNGTTTINGSGVSLIAGGGTGQSSYTSGDILYYNSGSSTTALQKLAAGAGNNGKILTVSGGLPQWASSLGGGICSDCVLNDPSAQTSQVIAPTTDITSLQVKQTSAGSPTSDIFDVCASSNCTGSNRFFYVDSSGNVSTGAISNTTLSLTPASNVTALTLVGTNVTSSNLAYINAKNSSGTIFNLAYGATQTLSANSSLIGEAVDLSTNITANGSSGANPISVTGEKFTLPAQTNANTSGTNALKGIVIADGGGLNQTGSGGTTIFTGADITIPALTQTAGTLTGNGVLVTTPSSITTGGTANGINVTASGIAAGTLNGINISNITAGSGTETGLNIGNNWDTGVAIGSNNTSGQSANGISIGAISSTGANNNGISLGTLTGGTSTNYQISTGAITGVSSATSAQLNLGNISGASSATTYGINLGTVSSNGNTSAGINIAANSSTATTNYGINIGNLTGAAGTNYGIDIGTIASGSTNSYGLRIQGPAAASTNYAIYADAGAQSYFAGNVGIGTTSPGTPLQIAGSSATEFVAASFINSAGSANELTTLQFLPNTVGPATGSIKSALLSGGNDGNLSFWTRKSGASTEQVIIDNNGNVGIGTTSPNNKLEVSGTSTQFRASYDSSDYATIGATSTGATTLTTAGSNPSLTLATGANNGNIAITPNGTGSIQLTSGVTTGTSTSSALSLVDNSLTTGTAFDITSTSITSGNFFNISNGSSVFSISNSAVTTSLPTNFTSSGDVAIAYDINFTNPITSNIKSTAPISIQAGETFNSSNLTLQTYNNGSVVVDNNGLTTGNGLVEQANALTSGNALYISSTSTAGTTSGNSYLLNLSRSGTNSNSSHTAYGISSSVTNTGTTSTNIAGDFTATGATTDYGVKVEALTGATSTGVGIGALSGATANTGISIGNITSAATANNFGINIGTITSQTSATSYAINTGAISGAGTATYGINLGANSATATTNYGIDIGAISGAGTTNYGLYVGAVSGAGSNYGAVFAGGNVGIDNTSPGQALDVTGSENISSNLLFTKQSAHTIQISDSTTSGTAGSALTLQGAAGNGAANGGALSLVAGAAGATSGTGGGIILTAGASGNVNSPGGNVTITAGAPFAGSNGASAGAGGSVTIKGGTVISDGTHTGNAGNGGAVSIIGGGPGDNNGVGGAVVIQGGGNSGNANSTGGDVSILGGTGNSANSVGGNITITAGSGGAGNGSAIKITAGTAAGSGTGGALDLVAGAASTSSGTGTGGALSLVSGAGGTSSGTSGTVFIKSGTAASSAQTGAISIVSGNATSANSGNVVLDTGTASSSTVGSLILKTGGNQAFKIDANSNVSIGAGSGNLAQGATNGFFYLENVATGKPNGTPTSITGASATTYDVTENKICVYNSGWVCTAALSDYSEWAPAAGAESGDVVTVTDQTNPTPDATAPFMLGKTTTAYDAKVVGVVSQYAEDANSANGFKLSPDYHAIALVGRVPVKVSTENGPIQIGDFLTSSSTPGVAMKATQPGFVVGKAMQAYNQSGTGMITIFVQPTYTDPSNILASLSVDDNGNLITPKFKTDNLILSTNIDLSRSDNKGLLSYTNGTNTANQPAYNLDVVGSLKNLETAVIGTQDTQSSLTNLQNSLANQLSIIGDQQTSLANNQATATATIVQLQQNIATQSANLASQIASTSASLTNQIASTSASLAAQLASASAEIAQTKQDVDSLKLTPPDSLLATGSSTLANLTVTSEASFSGQLSAYDLKISDSLKSLGDTSLGTTTIAGDLTVDGTLDITGSSLSTTGTLYLQNGPLADTIDLFNGKVKINNQGQLTIDKLIVGSDSTGTATLKSGTTEIDITTTAVTDKSHILVSPDSEVDYPLYVDSKTAGIGFKVKIKSAPTNDVPFDWWIVDSQ